jgi:hypothetical protein
LFRLFLLFAATPVTLALCARDLGRFDLVLIMITFACMTLLATKKYLLLVPVLMTAAMFVHESFLVLWTPTLLAAMAALWFWDGRERRVLVTLLCSAAGVAAAFIVLIKFGTPAMGYDDFTSFVQSRADFRITELSMRETYYSFSDHMRLASSSLDDPGSILNLFLALIVLSPAILVLTRLWGRALRNAGANPWPGRLLLVATLSGLVMLPIATDYGRWLSAMIFCNFFVIFFLVKRDVLRVEDLGEFGSGPARLLVLLLVVTYLLFGPLHDWEPYPYRENMIASALTFIAVMLFDIGFLVAGRRAGGRGGP